MLFSRILCPVDFLPSSREGLSLATRLAQGGAALELCSVFERERLAAEVGALPDAPRLIAELGANAEHELEAWRREVAAVVPGVEAVVVGGVAAWEAIVKEAGRFAADLIVVGAGARRHLLGSVAERVARHAACPVLIVAGAAPPLARLLCAVDFSPPAHEALRVAADLAGERGAALALVHALSMPAGLTAIARPEAEETLRAWAAEATPRARAPVATTVAEGAAADVILEAARAGAHDLVVLGTHGRTGIAHALLGSVVERVVRRAERSVLVVR